MYETALKLQAELTEASISACRASAFAAVPPQARETLLRYSVHPVYRARSSRLLIAELVEAASRAASPLEYLTLVNAVEWNWARERPSA